MKWYYIIVRSEEVTERPFPIRKARININGEEGQTRELRPESGIIIPVLGYSMDVKVHM